MELKEAVKVTKTLADQFAGLAKVADALALLEGGEKKLDGLLAQKASLEQIIATRRQELHDADRTLTDEFTQKQATLTAAIAQLTTDEAAARRALEAVQRDHAAMVERGRNAQREITEGLLEERRLQVKDLDEAIAKKTESLNRLTTELTKLRERVNA